MRLARRCEASHFLIRELPEMRRILRPGGWLALATAAGQGARLEPVPYAPRTRRWFFYREPGQLHEQLHDVGLQR
jgi:hypothetical protein